MSVANARSGDCHPCRKGKQLIHARKLSVTPCCCTVSRTRCHAVRSPYLAPPQACWALFPGYSSDPVLCLLGAGCLTTAAAGGELQEAAVPPGLEDLWPAGEAGVLLGVRRGQGTGARAGSACFLGPGQAEGSLVSG